LLAVYSSGLVKGTIPLPGGETAIYNASGLNYIRHKDWLGSSRLATTWNHAVYSKEAYAPFGETYNEAGTPDRSFTGQDQDVVTGSPATGVYDFLFRKYDPSAGRWLSPDPAGWGVVNQADPQSLDRYAYLENQPLSLIDPEGLAPPCPVSSDGVTPIGQCSNPSNPPPASAPNNGNQSSWQQKMRQAAHYMCGNSPADRVATSVKCGAAFGAVLGAVTGFVGGEVFGGEVTFGATGLVGAYLGAHVGGAVGAINGLGQGVALAGVCYAGFMYDHN